MNKEILLELYKSQSKIIYGYLIKCGCSREEAEDIVHDSFIKAIEYMDGISVEKLPSWLFKVALNNYKNKIKRKSLINEVSIDYEGFCSNFIGDNDSLEILLWKEKEEHVRECLSKLKEQSKILLIFKYDMELSYKEIGKLLGLSQEVVKTYLYRARNEFKIAWRDSYGR